MGSEIVTFSTGKIVCGRWKVISKLGAGGCGSVYKVEDLLQKGYMAALKAEAIAEEDCGVLKLEAGVLKKLAHRKHVIRLLQSGRRTRYRFIVMTICGSDLMSLKRKTEGFGESTILRIGVHSLYAIKQLHEIGFVHRDVKPGNMMNGANGRDRRIIFLIDYGMVRNFVVRDEKGSISLRKPRKTVLLRGTLRYCSISVHKRLEQGRVDDLWAMLYMLGELYVGLPWNRITVEKEILKEKETQTDDDVFKNCPEEFTHIAKYLRSLSYQDRPDYYKIYEMFISAMKRENYSFSDKFEWEEDNDSKVETALDYSDREKTTMKALRGMEKEFLMYTNINPKNFKEVILKI